MFFCWLHHFCLSGLSNTMLHLHTMITPGERIFILIYRWENSCSKRENKHVRAPHWFKTYVHHWNWKSPENQVACFIVRFMLSVKPRFTDPVQVSPLESFLSWGKASHSSVVPWHFVWSSILLHFTLHCNSFTDLSSSKTGIKVWKFNFPC